MKGKILIAAIISFLIATGIMMFSKNQPSAPSVVSPTPGFAKKQITEIDRNGKTHVADAYLIRRHLGCKSTDNCWNELAGLTANDTRSFKTFDLDVNHDNVISEADMKAVEGSK